MDDVTRNVGEVNLSIQYSNAMSYMTYRYSLSMKIDKSIRSTALQNNFLWKKEILFRHVYKTETEFVFYFQITVLFDNNYSTIKQIINITWLH